MNSMTCVRVLLILLFLVSPVSAERATHGGKVVLFGNLHAHSALSDDVKDALKPDMSPQLAFQYAHANGLDFLAITDHHKGQGDRPSDFLKLTQEEYKKNLYDVAMAYNRTHRGKFMAIPGIEWGTISKGNHVNVFGAKMLPDPEVIRETEYDELYTWANTHAEFLQFNHPNSWKKKEKNKHIGNYGEKLYSGQDFINNADPSVHTLSILTTVAGGHISGKHRHADTKTHRTAQWENFYRRYLNKGFHLAPSGNQDTHFTNWGTVTAGRTAVWADSATYKDLMKAFKAHRVYVTEDDEMAVVYQVKYKGKIYWMGDTIKLDHDSDKVDLSVKVWQGKGSDNDPLEEGPYTIELLSDHDGIGRRQASVWDSKDNVASTTFATWPSLEVVAGEYLYVRVTEENGKDNPVGDGDDEIDNSTGHEGADGKRDDMNDSAWTAPIWFTR